VRLHAPEEQVGKQPTVTLSYKRGSKRITTRRPVVEIATGSGDLFSTTVDILLEAQDREGNVVGEAQPGGAVNPATGTLALRPNDTVQVTIKMSLEFEGKFALKALDPTTLATFAKLDLETDYMV